MAKQLSTATTPLCFRFVRCCVVRSALQNSEPSFWICQPIPELHKFSFRDVIRHFSSLQKKHCRPPNSPIVQFDTTPTQSTHNLSMAISNHISSNSSGYVLRIVFNAQEYFIAIAKVFTFCFLTNFPSRLY